MAPYYSAQVSLLLDLFIFVHSLLLTSPSLSNLSAFITGAVHAELYILISIAHWHIWRLRVFSITY